MLFRKVIASKLTLNVTGDEMAYGKLAIQRSKKGNSAFRASDWIISNLRWFAVPITLFFTSATILSSTSIATTFFAAERKLWAHEGLNCRLPLFPFQKSQSSRDWQWIDIIWASDSEVIMPSNETKKQLNHCFVLKQGFKKPILVSLFRNSWFFANLCCRALAVIITCGLVIGTTEYSKLELALIKLLDREMQKGKKSFCVGTLTLAKFYRHVTGTGTNFENCVRFLNARLLHHTLDHLRILQNMLTVARGVEHQALGGAGLHHLAGAATTLCLFRLPPNFTHFYIWKKQKDVTLYRNVKLRLESLTSVGITANMLLFLWMVPRLEFLKVTGVGTTD